MFANNVLEKEGRRLTFITRDEDEEKAEAAVPKKEKKVIIFWIIHTHFYLGTAWLVGNDEEDEAAVPKKEKKVIIFWIIHTHFYLDTPWLVGDGDEDEEEDEAAVPKEEKKVIIFWIIHTYFYLGTAWLVGDDEEEDEAAVPKREKKVIIFWIIHTQFYLDTAWLVGDEGCWDPLPWWKNLHLAGKKMRKKEKEDKSWGILGSQLLKKTPLPSFWWPNGAKKEERGRNFFVRSPSSRGFWAKKEGEWIPLLLVAFEQKRKERPPSSGRVAGGPRVANFFNGN